jgi:6-pyruvoyltetrahydropterin/6-carboxytetrahydropterin synthase
LLSDSKRETMHGHDYQVSVSFTTSIIKNDMSFDCRDYKLKILALCEELDYRFIIPENSSYLTIREDDARFHIKFAAEEIAFYKKDVVLLPVENVTLEGLSLWFLNQLLTDQETLNDNHIEGLIVTVYNGRGASAASVYGRT